MNAVSFLLDLAKSGTRCERLPAELSPATRAEAYAMQVGYEAASDEPLRAWKIAATSIAGQKHIGVDGPLAGRYIAERVAQPGSTIPFGANHMKVAEVEFAFRLGQDIPPRETPYSEAEVFDAVASLHPAIEIPDSRFDHFEKVGAEHLIADNACAHWLVIGEAAPDFWRNLDLAEYAPIGRVVGKPDVLGKGSNVLGSPRTAMTWLVNELAKHGVRMRKDQYVSTGTCVVPMAIAAGDHVEGDFHALGRIEIRLGE